MAHPGKRIVLFFQDEARFGQKGRGCRRWWLRGQRPTGPVDQRYTFAYAFAAVEPATGRDFCLVLPAVSTVSLAGEFSPKVGGENSPLRFASGSWPG
jgi:hypothetical protein